MATPSAAMAGATTAVSKMESVLERLPFWKLLTDSEKELVQQNAVIRLYKKGTRVYSSERECLGMLFVMQGEMRTYLLSEEGREVTLCRIYPNDLCVLSAACVISQISFDTQMSAQKDTEALMIPPNIVLLLKEKNLSVRCFLYELATKRFSDVMWAMQQILFKRLDQRLALFLMQESQRLGTDTIHMTHEQIAQQISSAREAVARMLKQFSEDGLVELKRGAIRLLDQKGLKALQ